MNNATTADHYVGTELELFAHAVNWKTYWSAVIRPFVGATVLDVGAGIGSTAAYCCGPGQHQWVALEPDAQLLDRMAMRRDLPGTVVPVVGTLAAIDAGRRFETILYIDVLEHIEDDRQELANAFARLCQGGHLVVLCPAHQSLFSPFDASIGHFRRYNKQMMRDVAPAGSETVSLRYLDCIGLTASLANRLLLKQSMPTTDQISTWDRMMVPLSRLFDPVIGYSIGKSVLAVWRKC